MIFKRTLPVFFAALSILVTGCFSQQLEEPTSRDYQTLVGEFKSLGGIRVNKTITHLFEEEDGDIFYTYSDRYSLDDNDYFNTTLEVYGVVMDYDSLDKPVLQVKRISDAPKEDAVDFDVEAVPYKDTELGFGLSYPNNWTLDVLRDSIRIDAPLPEVDSEEETAEDVELSPDFIIVAELGAELETNSDSTDEERQNEIQAYVEAQYPELAGLTPEKALVGPDKLFALTYKFDQGNQHYFVPRSGSLFEISFYHTDEEDGDRIQNTNTFSTIVSSFRFLSQDADDETESAEETLDEPETELDAEDAEPTVEEDLDAAETEEASVEEVPVAEEASSSQIAGSEAAITFDSFAKFESRPFGFKGQYPALWYYAGNTGGYDFGPDSFADDEVKGVIRLELKSSGTVGSVDLGANARVTVELDGQYFILTGPDEYQSTMEIMAESIELTDDEA